MNVIQILQRQNNNINNSNSINNTNINNQTYNNNGNNNEKPKLTWADEVGEELEQWENTDWTAGKDLNEEDWNRFIQESQPIQLTETEIAYEKWWISQGKNKLCPCGQTNHHRHMYCKKCQLILDDELAYPKCQCTIPTSEKSFSNQLEYNNKDVKDALFGEATIFGERINIIIDSGSKGSAIAKQFLDRKMQNIDGVAQFKIIDIQGKRTSPLGMKNNVQVNIEGIDIGIDMVVTEFKDYNLILGNDWISKV